MTSLRMHRYSLLIHVYIYLILSYPGLCSNVLKTILQESLDYFGERRTDKSMSSKFQGVETPSQVCDTGLEAMNLAVSSECI